MSSTDQSHARRNPLTGQWVLVSPQRLSRPWQGLIEEPEAEDLPRYDADCYLCPGNDRVNGEKNPAYEGPFIFDNDFPALTTHGDLSVPDDALFASRGEAGVCRVICYTERHNLRLATMTADEVVVALGAMFDAFTDLDARDDIAYVQIFENRGAMMGCSNPHPHAQVWATTHIPTEPALELQTQQEYLRSHGSSLLVDYVKAEVDDGSRIVDANDRCVAVVPYWAVWPFETLLVPRRLAAAPQDLDDEDVHGLANVLTAVMSGYEKLFRASVPYSLGLHARPSDGEAHPEWQFHIHVCPPLLRSASVRKHMVGFEMFAMPQRDLTPESAARALRDAIEGSGQ